MSVVKKYSTIFKYILQAHGINFFLPIVLAGMKIEKVYTPIKEFEEIDIIKALTTNGRLHYPKIAKKTRVDDFLARRTHLKLLEERRLIQTVSRYYR